MPRTLQSRRACRDVSLLDGDLRAERLEPLDVLVYRAQADRAAPGERYARFPAARDERPEDEDRSAHRLDLLVGRDRAVEALSG